MTVDFHVHSKASDGSYSPAAIARMTGPFSYAALTDHDTCDGIADFLSEPPTGECRRIAGIELSIDPGEGFDMFHLLGLGIDPKDAGLGDFRHRILAARDERNGHIIENFAKLGIDLGNDVREARRGMILARPHFAKWLVRHGYAASVREAFAKYLLPDSPAETSCYEEGWHPPQEEAFAVVHAAGGLCVMAHPKFWKNEWKVSGCDFAMAERNLAVLREMGLDGLEAVYQANSPGENDVFTQIADRLGLLKSAGSDFHGSNKPAVTIGMEVGESFIRPLLDRLAPTLGA
ncbi:MAG: PHP domain-containing protein [Kiritimatiellae bacterium]|nr:PHP domain-containing protein [Kiritimatiellia bacterium]